MWLCVCWLFGQLICRCVWVCGTRSWHDKYLDDDSIQLVLLSNIYIQSSPPCMSYVVVHMGAGSAIKIIRLLECSLMHSTQHASILSHFAWHFHWRQSSAYEETLFFLLMFDDLWVSLIGREFVNCFYALSIVVEYFLGCTVRLGTVVPNPI